MTHGLHVFDAPRDTDHARWPCSRTRDTTPAAARATPRARIALPCCVIGISSTAWVLIGAQWGTRRRRPLTPPRIPVGSAQVPMVSSIAATNLRSRLLAPWDLRSSDGRRLSDLTGLPSPTSLVLPMH